MDLFIHYSDTGLDLYIQFDDDSNTRIPFVEGTEDKLRRYAITNQEVIDSLLAAGRWSYTIRIGEFDDPQDDDEIEFAGVFIWSGSSESGSGGGTLSARIGVVSLSEKDYLPIVQGEEKTVTFIVEAHGRFVDASADAITVKFKDAAGTLIIKTENDDSVIRVCEQLDIQIVRCVLSEDDTNSLVAGLLLIEIAFDNQKARLTHSIEIIETITEVGTGT